MNTEENNPLASQTGFGLPGDYFPSSAQALQNRLLWLEEHRDYPALKMAWRKEGFEVPTDYFQGLEQRLELLPQPTLKNLERKNPFALPEDVLSSEDLSTLVKLSSFAASENAFTVPADYFEANQEDLKSLQAETGEAKVLSLPFRILRFAAAAMLIISAGWWFYTKEKPLLPAEDCGGLACVDRKEIIKDKSIELLDEEDLNDLVNPLELERSLTKKQVSPSDDSLSEEEEFLENL